APSLAPWGPPRPARKSAPPASARGSSAPCRARTRRGSRCANRRPHRRVVACHPHHQIAALIHAAVFGGEGRALHPLLKASDAFAVAPFNLGLDAPERGVGEESLCRFGSRGRWYGQRRGSAFLFTSSTHLLRSVRPGFGGRKR